MGVTKSWTQLSDFRFTSLQGTDNPPCFPLLRCRYLFGLCTEKVWMCFAATWSVKACDPLSIKGTSLNMFKMPFTMRSTNNPHQLKWLDNHKRKPSRVLWESSDESILWGHRWNSLIGVETGKHCIVCVLSHVQHFVTLWTVACQAPLSTGFPKQEYWS